MILEKEDFIASQVVIRELFKETHQLQLFVPVEGDEMDRIRLWDLKEDIGYVDECNLKIVELIARNTGTEE